MSVCLLGSLRFGPFFVRIVSWGTHTGPVPMERLCEKGQALQKRTWSGQKTKYLRDRKLS